MKAGLMRYGHSKVRHKIFIRRSLVLYAFVSLHRWDVSSTNLLPNQRVHTTAICGRIGYMSLGRLLLRYLETHRYVYHCVVSRLGGAIFSISVFRWYFKSVIKCSEQHCVLFDIHWNCLYVMPRAVLCVRCTNQYSSCIVGIFLAICKVRGITEGLWMK